MKASAIAEATIETLKTELGKFEAAYHSKKVEFTTANRKSKRVVSLPYDRIDHNGGFVGDRTTDKAEFDAFIACVSRAKHDGDKQRAMPGVKTTVSGSLKKGKLTLGIRDTGLDGAKCEVGALLTDAKATAKAIKAIQAELADRAAKEAAAKAIADKEAEEKAQAEKAAELNKAVLEALMGSAPVPAPLSVVPAPAQVAA